MKPSTHLSSFRKKELDSFFKQATCIKKNQAFTVLKAPSSLEFGRVLIIASRKYGCAVLRNLLRRRCKAIFYENNLYIHRQDIVLIARSAGQQYDFDGLKKLLLAIFKNG